MVKVVSKSMVGSMIMYFRWKLTKKVQYGFSTVVRVFFLLLLTEKSGPTARFVFGAVQCGAAFLCTETESNYCISVVSRILNGPKWSWEVLFSAVFINTRGCILTSKCQGCA